jgi:hypothetical protein
VAAKLTVANVRGETALLFTVDGEGKLTYVEELRAGNATDLKTTSGTRWAAVFWGSKPDSLGYRVFAPEAIWLLRPAAGASPAPQCCTTTMSSR